MVWEAQQQLQRSTDRMLQRHCPNVIQQVPQKLLMEGFQVDLATLRKLINHVPVSVVQHSVLL